MKKTLFILAAGVFLFAFGFGAFLRPLLYTLTPLQRYYLSAYLASSWHENDPAATTEVESIWKYKPAVGPKKKGAPRLQYELAKEDDLLPIPPRELLWQGDILPFRMTRKAESEGWVGIERGLPMHVNSAKLAALLRDEFFSGEPVWRFFVQPAIMLCAALILWLLIRSWRDARRQRLLWRMPLPFWRRAGRNLLDSSIAIRKNIQARQAQFALPDGAPQHLSEAPTVAPTQPEMPPAEPSSNKQGDFVWDESKGLE